MIPFVPWTRAATPLAQLDSAALVQRLAGGDEAAFNELYRREAGPVYRYVLAVGGNPGWAADATQEAFIALATRPGGYDAGRGTLGAYLAGVARHALAGFWRAQRHEAPWPDEDAGPADAVDPAASPEAMLVLVQDTAEVWAALRRLPAPFREAIVLVDLQERPYAEAARIAAVEVNTLRTRLHRGRARLAALLCGPAGSHR